MILLIHNNNIINQSIRYNWDKGLNKSRIAVMNYEDDPNPRQRKSHKG